MDSGYSGKSRQRILKGKMLQGKLKVTGSILTGKTLPKRKSGGAANRLEPQGGGLQLVRAGRWGTLEKEKGGTAMEEFRKQPARTYTGVKVRFRAPPVKGDFGAEIRGHQRNLIEDEETLQFGTGGKTCP